MTPKRTIIEITSHKTTHKLFWGLIRPNNLIFWPKQSADERAHCNWISHLDDVIIWKYFPRYWPFVRGIHRLPVNSHKGQWRGALMVSLICAWMSGWVIWDAIAPLIRHSNSNEKLSLLSITTPNNFTWSSETITVLWFKIRLWLLCSSREIIMNWNLLGFACIPLPVNHLIALEIWYNCANCRDHIRKGAVICIVV